MPHFRTAWRLFKSYPGVFVVSTLILFASWVALELAVVALHRFGVVVNVGLHLAFLLWFSGLLVGLHRMSLEAVDGKAPRLADLTSALGRGPAFLAGLVIYLVAVAGGLVLLLVPGIYLAVRYALFGQVLATRPASAVEAFRDAGALSNGRWWTVCAFVLMALVLNVAGAAFLGLGLFVTFPVSLLATSGLYRDVQRSKQSTHGSPPSPWQA